MPRDPSGLISGRVPSGLWPRVAVVLDLIVLLGGHSGPWLVILLAVIAVGFVQAGIYGPRPRRAAQRVTNSAGRASPVGLRSKRVNGVGNCISLPH